MYTPDEVAGQVAQILKQMSPEEAVIFLNDLITLLDNQLMDAETLEWETEEWV